jgi:drug/metabolite transporter (DMT)-like permease
MELSPGQHALPGIFCFCLTDLRAPRRVFLLVGFGFFLSNFFFPPSIFDSFALYPLTYNQSNDLAPSAIPVRIESPTGRAPSRAAIAISITLLMTIWAINFLVVKIGIRHLPVITFASFRIVVAAVFMLILAPICRRLPMFREPSSSWSPGARNSLLLRDYWTFAYLGFFGVSVNQFFFTLGLRYTSVTHSSIIVGMAPINTLVLALLFRIEQPSIRKATGMLIALLGIVTLSSGAGLSTHSPTLLGDVITLMGSLGFAMYVVLGKRFAPLYDALTMTTWNFIFGGLILLPVALRSAYALGPFANWRAVPWQAWACIAFTGMFSSTLAYLFYFWLLRFLEASQLAAFSYLLPVSASALSIVFLHERGSWPELLGAALALFGVYWIESARNR